MLSCHVQRMPHILFADADSDFSRPSLFDPTILPLSLFYACLTQLNQVNRSQPLHCYIQANGLDCALVTLVATRVTLSIHSMTEQSLVPSAAHRCGHSRGIMRLAILRIFFALRGVAKGARNRLLQQRGSTPISVDISYRHSVRSHRTPPPRSHHHAVWHSRTDTFSLATRTSYRIDAPLVAANVAGRCAPGTRLMRTGDALRNPARVAVLCAPIAYANFVHARACLAFYPHSTIFFCAHG